MRTGGTGGKSTVKWAYFGKQRGASGKVKNLGWVKVGGKLWNSYIHPVNHAGRTGQGPHRAGLRPTRYKLFATGHNPNVSHVLPPSAQTKGSGNEVAGRNAAGAPKQTKGPVKNPVGKQGGGGGSGGSGSGGGSGGGGGGGGTARHNTNVAGKMIGNPNVGAMTKMSDAVKQADLQFGAQINDTKLAQAEGQAQHAQNLHDIGQWYNQIMGANSAAQTANAAASHQALGQDQGNLLSALAAIGGGANAGAGAVAAQGLSNQGLLQGLAANNDAFSNNLKPMLLQDQAGQMSAQSALDSQAARSLQQQLSDLQGQRGDAIVTNQDQIRQSNNALAQTRFGNRISKQQAVQAAVALAGNQRLQAQQLVGQKLNNILMGQQVGQGSNGGHTPWAQLKPADRYGAVTSAISALGKGATPQKVAIMLHSMGAWAPVHTMPFIKTFFQ